MNASSILGSLKKVVLTRQGAFLASLLYVPSLLFVPGLLFLVSACQTASPEGGLPTNALSLVPTSSQTIQEPSATPSFAGQFLAARYAQQIQDNAAASSFFSNALRFGQADEVLLKYSFINHYQNGNLAEAIRLARDFERLSIDFGLAAEPAIAKAVQDEDWQALIALSEKIEVSDDFYLLAGGLRALAYIGLGEPETALGFLHELERFVEVSDSAQETVILLLGGYIFEYLENNEEAIRYFRQVLAKSQNEYIVLSAGAGLWRQGKSLQAENLWLTGLSADAAPLTLIAKMRANSSTASHAPQLNKIIAQFLFDTSWLSADSYHKNLTIARAHLAISISPDLDAAHMALAKWYLNANNISRAAMHLNKIDEDAPLSLQRRLLQLALAEETGKTADALASLKTELTPDNEVSGDQLATPIKIERSLLAHAGGDMWRRSGACIKALPFYQLALDYGLNSYRLYRSMGICFEQTEKHAQAEQALLTAIELNPNDAISLNYLGYWWADEGRHLKKAITLIKKAVRLQPRSGYYADSLGWVYYRQGAFDEAVEWLEKAIQLTPTDAIISEHLGDAYWQTGRLTEARFKWQHALDMGIEQARVPALQDKLANGL